MTESSSDVFREDKFAGDVSFATIILELLKTEVVKFSTLNIELLFRVVLVVPDTTDDEEEEGQDFFIAIANLAASTESEFGFTVNKSS